MLTPLLIIKTIKKETQCKKWDGLPFEVRRFLKEVSKYLEYQEKYYEFNNLKEEYLKSLNENKGDKRMDAIKFVMESERMCNYYSNDCDRVSGPCPILKELKGCKLQSTDEKEAKKIVEVVETWSKNNPLIVLTEDQETAINGRIAEGYLWAVTCEGMVCVYFCDTKPIVTGDKDHPLCMTGQWNTGNRDFYNFLKDNIPVYLPRLIVEYGNNN